MRLVLSLALVLATAAPVLAESCRERIAYVRRVIDHDLSIGFIGKDVYAKMTADLDSAMKACQEGMEAKAQLLISSTQSRHGYPVH